MGAAGVVQRGHGRGLLREALGLGLQLLAHGGGGHEGLLPLHGGLGAADLLDGLGAPLAHLHVGQAGRGRLRLDPLGQADLRPRVELGGLLARLGQHELLTCLVPGRRLGGLRGLDVLDQALLRLGLGLDHQGLAQPLGLLDGAQALDDLLLLGHGLLHRDALADDLRHRALLGLQLLVLGDRGELRLPLAGDDLQLAVLLDPFGLDRDDPLAVLLGDRDLPRLVLLLDAELLGGAHVGGLGLQPLLGAHPGDLGLLAGPHGLDLALLLDLRVGLPALKLQNRLPRVHVLAGDLLLLVALELVRAYVLDGGELGDLADALGVEDVRRVELRHRRLLKEVDGGVLKAVAVQVGADDLDDLIPELVALGVEVDEVQLLADGLQRLGELRAEQFLERSLVAGACGADGLGHLHHVLHGLVDADEERDADVGADVVPADQAFLAGPFDLDGLHRDVHDLGLVEDGQHHRPRERHVDRLDLGDDQRLALLDLAEQTGDHYERGDDDDEDDGQEHAEAGGDDVQWGSLTWSVRRGRVRRRRA